MRPTYLIPALLATLLAPVTATWASPAQNPLTSKVLKANTPHSVPVTPTYAPGKITTPPALSTTAAAKAAQQVEEAFNAITTLQASFTQHTTGQSWPSQGTFSWKKPRQFLWQYTAPVKQKIIGTGTAVYFIDEDNGRQVTQVPVDAGLARLFSAQKLSLAAQHLAVAAVAETPKTFTVTLHPTSKGSGAEQLTSMVVGFTKSKTGALTLAKLETTDITRTTMAITFANVKANASIPGSLFAFTPGVYEQNN